MAIPSETGGIWLWVPMQALIPGHADQGPHPHGGADALERRADVVQVFPDHDSVTRLGTQTSYIDREAFTRIYPEFAQIGE